MSQTSAILEHNAFCPADAAMPTSLPSTPRIAEKLGEAAICHICHSLRWTRIKDVNNRETGFGPREFRFIWKEWIQWAQRLASSHTWNAKFLNLITDFPSVQFSCVWLCDPVDCSMPGLPVHHQLLELTQTCVHSVGDAIQPSPSLSSPSPPAFNLSQHQGLFRWVSSSHQVAKVWEFQLQHQFFQWIFRTDFL